MPRRLSELVADFRESLRSVLARALGRTNAGDPDGTRALGAAGERAAARHLRQQGYRVVARNLHVPAGEADLVCLAPDRATLVIVEVKTRRAPPNGSARAAGPATAAPQRGQIPPEANIDARKRAKLVAVARGVLASRRMGAHAAGPRAARIDVIAVDWHEAGPHEIRHYIDAVRAG